MLQSERLLGRRIGCVAVLHEGDNLTRAVNVRYVFTHNTENAITMDRITMIPMPYKDTTSASGLRARKMKTVE
jgi:hypothetical protein